MLTLPPHRLCAFPPNQILDSTSTSTRLGEVCLTLLKLSFKSETSCHKVNRTDLFKFMNKQINKYIELSSATPGLSSEKKHSPGWGEWKSNAREHFSTVSNTGEESKVGNTRRECAPISWLYHCHTAWRQRGLTTAVSTHILEISFPLRANIPTAKQLMWNAKNKS